MRAVPAGWRAPEEDAFAIRRGAKVAEQAFAVDGGAALRQQFVDQPVGQFVGDNDIAGGRDHAAAHPRAQRVGIAVGGDEHLFAIHPRIAGRDPPAGAGAADAADAVGVAQDRASVDGKVHQALHVFARMQLARAVDGHDAVIEIGSDHQTLLVLWVQVRAVAGHLGALGLHRGVMCRPGGADDAARAAVFRIARQLWHQRFDMVKGGGGLGLQRVIDTGRQAPLKRRADVGRRGGFAKVHTAGHMARIASAGTKAESLGFEYHHRRSRRGAG